MSWPLNNLPASHLNKSTARHLAKFFSGWELTTHLDLEMWHFDRHGGSISGNLADLSLSEGRDIYLLALYAGSDHPSLKHGYDKRYELETVGSALVNLDASRLMVCQPAATGFYDLLSKAIGLAFAQPDSIYGWFKFHQRMLIDHRRFAFGYEPIIHAITIRAMASTEGPQALARDDLAVGLAIDHCLSLTDFDASPEATAMGLAALIETISSIPNRAQPAQWKHTIIRRYSGLYAHLWRLQGHGVDVVAAKLQERLQLVVPTLLPEASSHQVAWMIKMSMACFIAPFPHSWAAAGIEIGDFLGCSLLDEELFGNVRAAAYNTALDPFVRKEGQGNLYPKLALDFLGRVDPDVYAPHQFDREGSRCTPWNQRAPDLAIAHEKVNQLMQRDIWHPALQGDKLAGVMLEDSAIEGIKQYLQSGGKANQRRAEALLQRYPKLSGVFARTITKVSEVRRLAVITKLTRDEVQGLPGPLRDAVFSVDLGL